MRQGPARAEEQAERADRRLEELIRQVTDMAARIAALTPAPKEEAEQEARSVGPADARPAAFQACSAPRGWNPAIPLGTPPSVPRTPPAVYSA